MAIIKVLSRHSPTYSGLINYILNESKVDKDEIYTHNLRSVDVTGYVREFMENEAFRRQPRSDQIYLFHEIISFHAQETDAVITKDMIDDLVQTYIELRGNTGVMLGAVHRDKEHIHIHFCSSGLHYRTGKSFGLSKAQLHQVKVQFQEYHKARYTELAMSAPKHGRGEQSLSHAEWHRRQRQQFNDVVRECFSQARSQQHFLELLRDNNLPHYERSGKPTGIEYDGGKFRFSRLLEDKQFDSLPVERGAEEQALAEIRAIRQRQQGRDQRDRDLDNSDIAR